MVSFFPPLDEILMARQSRAGFCALTDGNTRYVRRRSIEVPLTTGTFYWEWVLHHLVAGPRR